MCGIAGIVYSDASRPCDPAVVTAMRDVFPYRGPDDAGIFVDRNAGLGHRRLSIIDLGGGHQPMSEVSGHLWIVFNGEIYNYRQAREELVNRGYAFQTQSDTEVILQAYAALGEQCVTLLNGMFAFAIWDMRDRTLFLARDRMGVKPLYYSTPARGLRLRVGDEVAVRQRSRAAAGARRGVRRIPAVPAGRRQRHRVSGGQEPAPRLHDDRARQRGDDLALLVAAASGRAPGHRLRRGEGAACEPARGFRSPAPDQRRAGGHVLQRRRRLEPGDRARRQAEGRTRQHVLGRVRRGRLRRERVRAPGLQPPPDRPPRAAGRQRPVRRAVPAHGVAQRRAARLRQLRSHLRAEPARQAAGHRRPHRRGLGRTVRRLSALPHPRHGQVVPARAGCDAAGRRPPRPRPSSRQARSLRVGDARPRRCSTTRAICGRPWSAKRIRA